ncbi:hypothetical protein HORIV_33990 [Vreelandella olivaria]|uniref:Thiolase N-terminal domain-containing protein n=1 Tax=Vreelandella olivaria TaxID=390919 RepID=A0ABM7GK21_9GAMM|nr:hypothetical protein HORIV_33990 [Halomonas olivaria]
MQDAYIYDGLRTPFGRHGGSLAAVRPDELLGLTLKALVARNPFAPESYEEVLAGCTNQAGKTPVTWPVTERCSLACLLKSPDKPSTVFVAAA